ncbi:hypothetical protein QOM21_00760 [Streptomyces sp. Pv4-95]|uniref:hypothetical protein n=1 Tax=Streptomyces sp. Pv4-95 TaxID=3049543 RepID=UPI0038922A45
MISPVVHDQAGAGEASGEEARAVLGLLRLRFTALVIWHRPAAQCCDASLDRRPDAFLWFRSVAGEGSWNAVSQLVFRGGELQKGGGQAECG